MLRRGSARPATAFWEPFPKRFRVVVGGETIADSRLVIALHETGQLMRLGVPWSDIRRESFGFGASATEARTGLIISWSLRTANGVVEAAARSFEAPLPAAAALKDHVYFDLDKVDAWYLEDDLGYAHTRDPYHRCDVQRSSRHVVVRAGNVLIAETSAPATLFETSLSPRFYLPPDAVRAELLLG